MFPTANYIMCVLMICFAIFLLEIAKTCVKRKDIFIFDLPMHDKSEKRLVYLVQKEITL